MSAPAVPGRRAFLGGITIGDGRPFEHVKAKLG